MSDDPFLPKLILLAVLILINAFFAAAEISVISLSEAKLRKQADEGDKKAEKALALAEDYDKLLSTILIGNNIVNNVAATLSTLLFIKLIDQTNGPAVSTIVLTVVVLIFGEISPKSLAKESPESFAMFSAPLLRLFMAVLTPLNFLFSLWKKLLTRLFHKEQDEGITDEELVTIVSEAEDQGGLDKEESQLIRSAIRFDNLEAGDILTPRVDVVAVEDTSTLEEVAAVFATEGYSRLPVYHESIDDVVGVLHQKDLFSARFHGRAQLEPLVLDGSLDFAVTLNGEEHPRLVTQLLMDDQVYLCVADSLLQSCYGETAQALKEKAIKGADVKDFAREETLRHPYSKALWRALPQNGFQFISGTQPYVKELPKGCPFGPRCEYFCEACEREIPYREVRGGKVRCISAE